MGAKWSGLVEFGSRLERLPATARAEVNTALNENADRMVGLAKSLVPRDRGDLASSIRKEPGKDELQVRVLAGGEQTTRPVREGLTAPAFDYAARAEFGADDQPPHPFFFPAYRALKRAMRRRLAKALKAAAQTVAGGGA